MRFAASFLLKAIAIVFCLSAIGCSTKEGGFRPSKKLLAVYQQSVTLLNGDTLYVEPRTLLEKFDWDKRTLLSISYYGGNALEMQEVYSYDSKNRIASASLSGGYTTIYHYDGDKLDSITLVNAQRWVASVAFEHGRSRVKRVIYNKCGLNGSYKLSWDNENVGTLSPEEGDGDSYSFVYDNMTNPYQGLFSWWAIEHQNNLVGCVCPNNWITRQCGDEKVSYSFNYQDKYPIERAQVIEYDYIEYIWNAETQQNVEVLNHRYQKVIWEYEYDD